MWLKIAIGFILVLLITCITIAYLYFWPRFLFVDYGYHEIEMENEYGDWRITLSGYPEKPSSEMDLSTGWGRTWPPIAKKEIFGSPYSLSIWHSCNIVINNVEIIKSSEVIFTSDNVPKESGNDEEHCSSQLDIDLDYADYELVIYYQLKDKADTNKSIKVPLKTNYSEIKFSRFEIHLGI